MRSPMPQTCNDCPPADDLDQLIHGRLADPRASAVTEHVGSCSGCQGRLDSIASGLDARLTDSIRHLDHHRTPDDSALWPALSEAEQELLASTAAFMNGVAGGHPAGDLKLDFLKPTT